MNRIALKLFIVTIACSLSIEIYAQDKDKMRDEAKDVVKNFYSLMENMSDRNLPYKDKKKFKVEALNTYCDRRKTILLNNLISKGSKQFNASEYLESVITFFPYGADIRYQVFDATEPKLTEAMNKLHCMVEVRSEVINAGTNTKFSSHLIYNVLFDQIGPGAYAEAKIISSEAFTRKKFGPIPTPGIDSPKGGAYNRTEDETNNGKDSIKVSTKRIELEDLLLTTSNFRRCKGGHFTIGCQSGSVNCDKDECPVAPVALEPFDIQEHEVTNRQYLEFLKGYRSDVVLLGDYRGQLMLYPQSEGIQKNGDQWGCKEEYLDKPVVNVTWYGAITFANFYGLDLPTEAQWEYAAKAGNNTSNYQFSGSNNLFQYGFYEINSDYELSNVMKKIPNELNLYDMSGNVWEWCKDWYRKNAYSNYSKTQTLEKGTLKSVRGGGYASNEWECRVQNRWFKEPHLHANDIGFRCVKNY